MAHLAINDFSGSINQHSSPDLLAANETPLAINMSTDQVGNTASRLGSDLLSNKAGTTGVLVQGVQNRANGNQRYFWVANKKIYYYDGVNWDTAVNDVTINGDYADMEHFQNNIYYTTLGVASTSETTPTSLISKIASDLDYAYKPTTSYTSNFTLRAQPFVANTNGAITSISFFMSSGSSAYPKYIDGPTLGEGIYLAPRISKRTWAIFSDSAGKPDTLVAFGNMPVVTCGTHTEVKIEGLNIPVTNGVTYHLAMMTSENYVNNLSLAPQKSPDTTGAMVYLAIGDSAKFAYIYYNGIASRKKFAQTFKTNKYSEITSIDLWLQSLSGWTIGDVTINLYAVDGNHKPTGSSLGSAIIPDTFTYSWVKYTATFSSAITVTENTEYAFVISATPPAFHDLLISSSTGQSYADGSLWMCELDLDTWTSATDHSGGAITTLDFGVNGLYTAQETEASWDWNNTNPYSAHYAYTAEYHRDASLVDTKVIDWALATGSVTQCFKITQTTLPQYYLYKINDGDVPISSAVSTTPYYRFKYLTSGNNRLIGTGHDLFPRRIFYSVAGSDKFYYYAGTVASVSGLEVTINESIFNTSGLNMEGWEVYNENRAETAVITTVTTDKKATLMDIASLSNWVASDNVYIMSNYEDLDSQVTGIISLGDQTPFLGFTVEDMYVLDFDAESKHKIKSYGCAAHSSIDVIQGYAIWIGNRGIYRYANGMMLPQDITTPLRDDLNLKGTFNSITKTGLSNSVAYATATKYFLAIGDLSQTINDEVLTDSIIVYNPMQNSWAFRTYLESKLASSIIEYFDSSLGRMLIAGSRETGAIFEIDKKDLYTDDDLSGDPQDYTSTYYTKVFEVMNPEVEKKIVKAYVKLLNSKGVDISYSKAGSKIFQAWTTTDLTRGLYDVAGPPLWDYQRLAPFGDSNIYSIQLKFSSTGRWVLYYFAADFESQNNANLAPV